MNTQHQFRLRYVPWLTLGLTLLVWAIHLFSRWSGSSVEIRGSLGLEFGNAATFLTYALVHADLYHLTLNTLSLVFFGSVVELQAGRVWHSATIVMGILAGVAGAFLLHSITGTIPDDRGVGLSAGTYAVTIVAIGVIARHWDWEKWTLRVTLVFVTLVLTSAISDLWGAGLETLWDMSVFLFVAMGVCASCYRMFKGNSKHYGLAPLLWVFTLLMADLSGMGWAYSTVGHLGGLITGALLMPIALRERAPTLGTDWLKRGLLAQIKLWRDAAKKASESRRFAGGALVALLIVLVVLVFTTDNVQTNLPLEMFSLG